MNNRLDYLFEQKKEGISSIFITAGFPKQDSLLEILPALEKSGADLVEIGIPFSDPLADGSTIQASSSKALENGMNLNLLMDQIHEVRRTVQIPIVLMGYFNPVYRYGLEKLLSECDEIGVDGMIIPDLSFDLYLSHFEDAFDAHDTPLIFLIAPDSQEERIREIDSKTKAFIYLLSSSSTTGKSQYFTDCQKANFQRILKMELRSPVLLGFGIHDARSFKDANSYFNGAIIGSAFIRHLDEEGIVATFLEEVMGKSLIEK